jgi:beta-galactosidase
MSKIVKTSENIIVNARRRAEVCVLFYPPYYATELERPVESACELAFTPSVIRRPAYFDGLLKALQILNIDYDMVDLTKASSDVLRGYRQIWAFCIDEMNAGDQQTIVDYASGGGNMVIFPYLPDREMSQRPCTVIRDALSAEPSGREITDSPLIDIFDLNDIKCANPQITYSEKALAGAEIIARTISGAACGFIKPLGSGSVIHLGTWIGFDTEGHKPVYETILKKSRAKLRHTSSTNDSLIVRERFTGDSSAMLFIGNYYNETQTGRVTYTHPETGEDISVPWSQNEMLLPALYAMLSPVCLELSPGLKILHSTSDLLGFEVKDGHLMLTLFGDRDLEGEIVFEGIRAGKIVSATIAGKTVRMVSDDKRVAFVYSHDHEKEILLDIKMD